LLFLAVLRALPFKPAGRVGFTIELGGRLQGHIVERSGHELLLYRRRWSRQVKKAEAASKSRMTAAPT
jgi:hypothetical protein